jgi:hypothetical protein
MVLTKKYKFRKSVRFEFLNVVTMNIRISLDVMQFYVVSTFRTNLFWPSEYIFYHLDGDIRFLRSVDIYLPYQTASHSRRL